MTRIRVALCAAMVVAFATTAPSASAAVTVGQAAPEGLPIGHYAFCTGGSEWRQQAVATGSNYVVPNDGILTSWSTRSGTAYRNKLKVLRPNETGPGYTVLAAEDAPTWGSFDALNTFETRIPVEAGDQLAVRSQAPESQGSSCLWHTQLWTFDLVQASFPSDVPVGSTITFPFDGVGSRLNVSAVLEPDADGDGYIDGTEDLCPNDRAAQAAVDCNEPPTVAGAAGDANGYEGDTLATAGSFADADDLEISKTGAGTLTGNADGTWSWALETSDDASGTVTVTATDPFGETVSDTFTYSAADRAPKVGTAASDASGEEGDALTASGDFAAAGVDDLTITKNGAGSITLNPDGRSWSWQLTPADNGSGTVTVKATDDDGSSVTDTFEYTVANKAPTVRTPAEDVSGYEGDTLTVSGEFDDVPADDLTITDDSAGSIEAHADGTWSWELATTDDAGGTVTVTATDDDGGVQADTFDYEALNKAPTVVVAPEDADGYEGDDLTASGTFTDVAGDTVTVSATGAGAGEFSDSGLGTWSWLRRTSDDVAPGSVTVTASDGEGGSVSRTFGYSAANVSPAIGEFVFSGPACEPALGFAVADRGSDDTHVGSVSWGDGSAADSFGGLTFAGAHDYSSLGAGSYTVTAKSTDDDGGTAERSATHTIHNKPSGILQPVNGTGRSSFKLGSTIPVKIAVAACNGSPVATLAPQVSVVHVDETPTGTVEEAASTASPTSGTTMRWDESAQQYVYNLATKPLQPGDWKIVVSDASFGAPVTAELSLRK